MLWIEWYYNTATSTILLENDLWIILEFWMQLTIHLGTLWSSLVHNYLVVISMPWTVVVTTVIKLSSMTQTLYHFTQRGGNKNYLEENCEIVICA